MVNNEKMQDIIQNETINIFVYGTLKKGYPNHKRYCSNAIRIIPAKIKGTMYDTTYGFPAVQLKGYNNVYGEIITVPKQDLPNFDYLQGVPYLYQRETIKFIIKGKNEEAYIYTMKNLPKQAVVIPNGYW